MDALKRLDAMPEAEARAAFLRCCGSQRWAAVMTAGRPYHEAAALFAAADVLWNELGREAWLEAFRQHPRIGGRDALRTRFAATRAWETSEQASASAADAAVLEALAKGNCRYESRFGYIFIVCATGQTAEDMLAQLEARLGNDPDQELRLAAAEQARITRLRLQKLLAEVGS